MASQAPLFFDRVSKQFGKQEALRELSLSLNPGEILGFIGPNGAGKTTSIHIALGLLHPSSGRGAIFGIPFHMARARRRVGFLPDAPTFFAHSAGDAVTMTAKLQGVGERNLRGRVEELLARLELPNKKDARKLSRGMQQRLGLAQALIHDPDLLILDEPTSALDPEGVLEVREILRAARESGKSVFFSSHQLAEVEQICDRVAFLHQGKLVREGRLDQMLFDLRRAEVVFRGLPSSCVELAAFREHLVSDENPQHSRWLVPQSLERTLIEKAWACGGELISAAPVRRSLEELFLSWSSSKEEG